MRITNEKSVELLLSQLINSSDIKYSLFGGQNQIRAW
jgi:hypothetical protein